MSLSPANDGPGTRSGTPVLSLWIPLLTSSITIMLTVWNAFTKHDIDKRAQALETAKVELEATRERVDRYAFVQKLFPDLLSADSSKRVLTINLITLALNKDEAEKLFGGFQNSGNEQLQDVGKLGYSTVQTEEVSGLVSRMVGGDRQARIDATRALIARYPSSTAAIDQTLNLYSEANIRQLSPSARINTLSFLSSTDPAAWTHAQIVSAEAALQRVDELDRSRQWRLGAQTRNGIIALRAHLQRVKGSQQT